MSALLYEHIIRHQASSYLLQIDKAGDKVFLSDNYRVNLTAATTVRLVAFLELKLGFSPSFESLLKVMGRSHATAALVRRLTVYSRTTVVST